VVRGEEARCAREEPLNQVSRIEDPGIRRGKNPREIWFFLQLSEFRPLVPLLSRNPRLDISLPDAICIGRWKS